MRVSKIIVSLALSAFFLSASSIPVLAGPGDGRKAFEAKKCGQCHQSEGPAREKTIKDQLAKKGPELWYAGSKFKKEFLERWLSDPRPIRPLEYNSLTKKNPANHPKLAVAEAVDMAAYLMTLKSVDVLDGAVVPRDNPKGRAIFIKKQSCYGCHEVTVRGNKAGGLSGPALTGASKRLNPDWIYAYMTKPKIFKPVKDMPDYTGYISDAEMKDLSAYVGGLD